MKKEKKREKYLIGMYIKSYHLGGIIGIPRKWVNYNNPYVYCAKLHDKITDKIYLTFYNTHDSFHKEMSRLRFNDSLNDIEVLSRSRHMRFPFTNFITLPKSFCDENATVIERQLRLVGKINSFEVWKERDFEYDLDEGDMEDIFRTLNKHGDTII